MLGSLSAWDKALQMPAGGRSALEAFSRPIAERLPPTVTRRRLVSSVVFALCVHPPPLSVTSPVTVKLVKLPA